MKELNHINPNIQKQLEFIEKLKLEIYNSMGLDLKLFINSEYRTGTEELCILNNIFS